MKLIRIADPLAMGTERAGGVSQPGGVALAREGCIMKVAERWFLATAAICFFLLIGLALLSPT